MAEQPVTTTDRKLLFERVTPQELTRIRRNVFLKKCTRIMVQESLYHGSPLQGLEQIRTEGRLLVQEHGILPGSFFCVSVNDNMLRFFSDNEGITGMAFNPRKPLACLKLDWFHFHLLDRERTPTAEPFSKKDERLAEELGYYEYPFRDGLDEATFLELIPQWVDGIIFPWGIQTWDWNHEAEIALTQKGCDELLQDLDQVVIQNNWVDREEAWETIAVKYLEQVEELEAA